MVLVLDLRKVLQMDFGLAQVKDPKSSNQKLISMIHIEKYTNNKRPVTVPAKALKTGFELEDEWVSYLAP